MRRLDENASVGVLGTFSILLLARSFHKRSKKGKIMKLKLCTFVVFAVVAILFAPANRSNAKVSGHAPVKTVSSLPASTVLDDWATAFSSFGVAVGENERRTLIRTAIVQLAMFDAVNAAVDGRFCGFASKPASAPDASPEAAAIRAAYIVALNEFQTPTALAMIESTYSASLASVIASQDAIAIAHGIEVGETAANNVIDARKNDHRNDPELTGYTPGSGPGVWIPTPNGTINPQSPFLQFVMPFGYDEPSRFRPAPPPALDSKTYTNDYNEIKDLGRSSETSRTAEQSATAQFWSPSATALWIANVRSLARSMDLLTAARFEAIGIACATNGLLAAWDGKYTYMFWRPVTAIRAGDIDDNPDTQADPSWTPFIVTPSHPEYPAAHTTVGASVLGFYTVWFDTDQFALQFKGLNGAVRNYSSVNEIHAEEGNARVWGGMHFRNSTEVGTAVGSKIGKYTATHLLKPLD
jgi:hypothetical protein